MANRFIIMIVQLAVGGWIDLRDLCHVDSALCQHMLREIFLAELEHSPPLPGFVEDVTHDTQNYFKANYVRWLRLRNIAILHIYIRWDSSDVSLENMEGCERLAAHLRGAFIKFGNYEYVVSPPCDESLLNFAAHFSDFPALFDLYLVSQGTITAQTLSTVLAKCANLQHLTLERFIKDGDRSSKSGHRCAYIKEGENFNRITDHCPNLKSISFKSIVPYRDLQLFLIHKPRRLVKLVVANVGPISDDGQGILCDEINFSGIESLELRSNFDAVLQPLLASILNSDTSRLTNLQIYSEEGTHIAEIPDLIDGITRQCPQLTALSYSLPGQTLTNTIHIAEQLTALCTLRLPCSSAVRDETIIAVMQHCRSLTHLDVHGCENVTDRGVLSIKSDHIIDLDLYGLRLITDESIVALLTTLTPNLQFLDVIFCVGLTEAIYEPILNGTASASLRCCWLNISNGDYSENLKHQLEAVYPNMLEKLVNRKYWKYMLNYWRGDNNS